MTGILIKEKRHRQREECRVKAQRWAGGGQLGRTEADHSYHSQAMTATACGQPPTLPKP